MPRHVENDENFQINLCENCKKRAGSGGRMGLHDFCAACGKNLCDDCMKKGCCGNVPARSGLMEEADQLPDE